MERDPFGHNRAGRARRSGEQPVADGSARRHATGRGVGSAGRFVSERVGDLGERALLARLQSRVPRPSARVTLGIGDDAAVLAPVRNAHVVVTTDSLVEGVHFEQRWSAPGEIGHKALAASLSDLAAMGAEPRWALLSLVLPDAWLVADFDALLDGVLGLTAAHGVELVGGNLTRSPGPLVVETTCGGIAPPRRFLTRSGARPGDDLFVSGTIGGAGAGLAMLRLGGPAADVQCVARYRRPEPRVRLGLALARNRAARAAVDLSDGLADAVRQMAEASGTGAVLDARALPVEPGARRWHEARGEDAIRCAIASGEDYELLIAVPPRWRGRLAHASRRVAAPPLTRIGSVTRDRALTVRFPHGDEPLPRGYEHFLRG